MVTEITEWVKQNKELIKGSMRGFLRGLISFLKNITQLMRPLIDLFTKFMGLLGGSEFLVKSLLWALTLLGGAMTVKSLMTIIGLVRTLAAAIGLANAAAFAVPLAIAAAVIAVAAIIEDLYQFFTGGESVTGALVEGWKKAFEYVRSIVENFSIWIGEKITGWASSIGSMFKSLASPFSNFGSKLAENGGSPSMSYNTYADRYKRQSAGNVSVSAPINVVVPPGTNPADVPEAIESGIFKGVESIFREANRANAPSVGY